MPRHARLHAYSKGTAASLLAGSLQAMANPSLPVKPPIPPLPNLNLSTDSTDGGGSSSVSTSGGGSTSLSPAVIAIIVILGAAFFLVSCYAMIAKFCMSREVFRRPRRRGQVTDVAADDDYNNPAAVTWPLVETQQGLEEAIIQAIPVFEYRKKDGQLPVARVGGKGGGADCAVCLSEFEEGERVRVLPKCSHAFHLPCIDMWLHSHSNCPLCRANINIIPTTTTTTTTTPALDNSCGLPPPPDATSIAGENAQPPSAGIDDAAQNPGHHLHIIFDEKTHGEEADALETRLTRLRPLNREHKTKNLMSRQPHDHVTDGLLADQMERIHLQLGIGFRCFSTGRASPSLIENGLERLAEVSAVGAANSAAVNTRMTRSSSLGFCMDNTIHGHIDDEYKYNTREGDHQVIDLNHEKVVLDTVQKLGSSSSSSSNDDGVSTSTSEGMRYFKSKSLNHDNSDLKSLKAESVGDPLMGRMLLSLKGPRAVKRSFSGGRLFGFKMQKNTTASTVGTSSSTQVPPRLPI